MKEEIMTRREAAQAGLRKYDNGRRCKRGHDSRRYTATGVCVDCSRGYAKQLRIQFNTLAITDNVRLVFTVHSQDKKVIEEFVESLRLARELGI